MKIIIIAGGSGSGKSLAAKHIDELFPEARAEIISMDSYYNTFTGKDWDHYNRDSLEAIDYELLTEQLKQLQAGQSVEVPQYDFVEHRRTEETTTVHPADYLILEGIFALAPERLRQLADIKIFIAVQPVIQLARRIKRDFVHGERKGDLSKLGEEIDYYLQRVYPTYHELIEPSGEHADITIDNNEEGLDNFLLQIEKFTLENLNL